MIVGASKEDEVMAVPVVVVVTERKTVDGHSHFDDGVDGFEKEETIKLIEARNCGSGKATAEVTGQ